MTERNKTIDKLRGICMLGVLGIHTGSLVLMSVSPNQHLSACPLSFLYQATACFATINPERKLITGSL